MQDAQNRLAAGFTAPNEVLTFEAQRSQEQLQLIEAQNLTGERSTLYIDDSSENTLFETEVGTTYTLGATYKF